MHRSMIAAILCSFVAAGAVNAAPPAPLVLQTPDAAASLETSEGALLHLAGNGKPLKAKGKKVKRHNAKGKKAGKKKGVRKKANRQARGKGKGARTKKVARRTGAKAKRQNGHKVRRARDVATAGHGRMARLNRGSQRHLARANRVGTHNESREAAVSPFVATGGRDLAAPTRRLATAPRHRRLRDASSRSWLVRTIPGARIFRESAETRPGHRNCPPGIARQSRACVPLNVVRRGVRTSGWHSHAPRFHHHFHHHHLHHGRSHDRWRYLALPLAALAITSYASNLSHRRSHHGPHAVYDGPYRSFGSPYHDPVPAYGAAVPVYSAPDHAPRPVHIATPETDSGDDKGYSGPDALLPDTPAAQLTSDLIASIFGLDPAPDGTKYAIIDGAPVLLSDIDYGGLLQLVALSRPEAGPTRPIALTAAPTAAEMVTVYGLPPLPPGQNYAVVNGEPVVLDNATYQRLQLIRQSRSVI